MKILEMHLLEDLKIWLRNFKFGMIYIIKKMLLVPKNHLNYLKDSTFEFFFKEYNTLFFLSFFKLINFNDAKFRF